ncbi:MAG: nucleotide exchange factor GrpE [Actinobacteria bacterium]|nr:nucleotide exchange factor GrpE [Actinomycetota bacterium]
MTDEAKVVGEKARVRESEVVGELEGSPTIPEGMEAEPADDLQARLLALETERDELLGNLQRVAADFDNYRKRAVRDQQALVARAHERLVKELLPVLDDLERALDAASKHEEATLEEGVQLVHREFASALSAEGLVEVDTAGRFDPHVHEALLSQPSEAEEGSVVQVIQKGYRLGDRVLRPARVVVAAPIAPPVQESGSGQAGPGDEGS